MNASPDDVTVASCTEEPRDQAVQVLEQVAELLAECTETGRLARAHKLAGKVTCQVDKDDVVDITNRRIQHGCRDFQGQARKLCLCKHVAATLLALEPQRALSIVQELANGARAPASGVVAAWRLEVITRFSPSG